MLRIRKLLLSAAFIILVLSFVSPNLFAKDKEYEAIVSHLQKTYQAKKVKIPFMWLARFAVKIVRPAGVKSFSFTMFENLQFSANTLETDLKFALSENLSSNWLPIMRIRSRSGEQIYAYTRESGNNLRMMLVSISGTEATVIRATFDPAKLVDFLDNPKIFGISIGDDKQISQNNIQSN